MAEPTVHREAKTGAEILDVAAGCRFPGLVSGRHFNKPAKRSRYRVTPSSNSDRTAKSTQAGRRILAHPQIDTGPKHAAGNVRIPWFAIVALGSVVTIVAALIGAVPVWVGIAAAILMIFILLVRWGWYVLDCEVL